MTLQQNTDHIQTTHIGSLPRPHNTNPHAQRLLSIASSKARGPETCRLSSRRALSTGDHPENCQGARPRRAADAARQRRRGDRVRWRGLGLTLCGRDLIHRRLD